MGNLYENNLAYTCQNRAFDQKDTDKAENCTCLAKKKKKQTLSFVLRIIFNVKEIESIEIYFFFQ